MGQSVGGLLTIPAARVAGGSGLIDADGFKSVSGLTPTLWVYRWTKSPSVTCTDKSTFVANVADQPYKLVGHPYSITLGNSPGTWDTATYGAVALSTLANFKNQDASPGVNIYECIVAGTAFTTPSGTTDLSERIGGLQD